jgi:hypothetical protein
VKNEWCNMETTIMITTNPTNMPYLLIIIGKPFSMNCLV